MKRTILTFVIAIATAVIAQAQQISVVSPQGATQIYSDLNLAIQGASAGSTLYLSGGGFQVNDSSTISKQLTIIGVGHRADNDNADGSTTIGGNIRFIQGADNSALMGVHLTGNVNIANGDGVVNAILVRFCNVNAIVIGHANCQNILINQNYIRNTSDGGNSAITFTNNILHSIQRVSGGIIDHNLVRYGTLGYYVFQGVDNSQIKNNILVDPGARLSAFNCIISNNMLLNRTWEDNSIEVEDWDDVFVGAWSGININDNYALKGTQGKNAGTDGTDIGIYGGTGFSDAALPPGPRIVSKKIADQTDSNGNLQIEIQVSAQ